ncbi:hypothetical protein, partial [Poseidonocella sp. HB161398]|uniref:hypothetical protein n=1 Tax=Poseidonocella sp. HB161398 TaxID=2320855 RepID=UPI001980E56A
MRQSGNDPGDRFLPNAPAFGAQASSEPLKSLAEVERPHAKIGQLVVERDAPQRFRGPTGATVAAPMSRDGVVAQNWWDSSCEPSMLAGLHEQTSEADLQDHQLASV